MAGGAEVTVVGAFSDRDVAERASSSLQKRGLPPEMIQTISQASLEGSALTTLLERARFTDEQLNTYTQQLEQGSVLLAVDTTDPPDRVVTALGESGAALIDVAQFIRDPDTHHTVPLREETLNVDKVTRIAGEAVVRKIVENVAAQADVEVRHEELDVEYVSVGEVVNERRGPWREGDVLVVPVYEEQLRVVRQLVMREQLRIRLHSVRETHTIADTVRRERAVIEDPDQTHRINVHHRDESG